MTATDDLAAAIGEPGPPRLGFRQGTIIEFDTDTGFNVIDVGEALLEDIPCLNVTDAVGMLPGMNVGLLTFQSSWWIIGRIAAPGTPDFGDIVVRGGDVRILSGGALKAYHEDDSEAAYFGPLNNTDGTVAGHGLLVLRDLAGLRKDVFYALQALDGSTKVVIGQASQSIDQFSAYTNEVDFFVDLSMEVHGPGDSYLRVGSGDCSFRADGDLFFNATIGAVVIESSLNQTFVDHTTTASAANCFISTAGLLQRVSSSRRYKMDIEDVRVDPAAVLKLRPRTWRDRNAVADYPDTAQWHVGFIAEELDEIGLTSFVDYDEQGRPDSIQYDRLSVGLLELAKDQERRLAALEARMTALDGKLAERPVVKTTQKPMRQPTGPSRTPATFPGSAEEPDVPGE